MAADSEIRKTAANIQWFCKHLHSIEDLFKVVFSMKSALRQYAGNGNRTEFPLSNPTIEKAKRYLKLPS